MKKIIVSSLQLSNFLCGYNNVIKTNGISDIEHKLILENKRLYFIDYYKGIDVEASEDWECELSTASISKLLKVVSAIDEQPITIQFKDSNG